MASDKRVKVNDVVIQIDDTDIERIAAKLYTMLADGCSLGDNGL